MNIDHPKFERDRSLLKFYLSILEGKNQTIIDKMRLHVKPEKIVDYIDKMMYLLVLTLKKKNSSSLFE